LLFLFATVLVRDGRDRFTIVVIFGLLVIASGLVAVFGPTVMRRQRRSVRDVNDEGTILP
jgi:hypothetical protein